MDMDELHKRWFSGDIREWFSEQRNIDLEFKGVDHHATVYAQVSIISVSILMKFAKDNFRWNLFDQRKQCKTAGIDEMYFEAHANLNYDIRATAGLTLIVIRLE